MRKGNLQKIKIKNNVYWNYGLFFLLLIIISFYYNFHEYFLLRPVSYHTWRQTDCTSLALNYYQTDMSFFQPRMHNLLGNDGRTLGELPLIYWIVGNLYKLFGPYEIIFRIVNTVIFFTGLLYVYKFGLRYFKNVFYALCLVLIAMSSPIVVFYAISFLPDVPALSIAYVALYYFYIYTQDRKKQHLIWSIILFTLAGLLKITALIFLCAIICVMFFELFFIKKQNRRLLKANAKRDILVTFIPFVVFFIWLSYAQYYQKVNENPYFSLDWDPFWIEPREKQFQIWERISQDWGWKLDFYYLPLIKVGLFSIVLLIFPRFNYVWRSGIFALSSGVILLIAMYYSALYDHDYYFINYLSIVVFFFIILFGFFTEYKIGSLWLTKGIFAILVLLGVMHAKERIDFRFSQQLAYQAAPFYNITQEYLNSKGITIDKRLLYDGDNMFNGALYLINRFGWNIKTTSFATQKEIDNLMKKGADFIFAVGKEKGSKELYNQYKLVDIAQDSVYIFDLHKRENVIVDTSWIKK